LALVGLLLAMASAVEAATLTGRLVNKTAGGQGVSAVEVTLTTYRNGKESGKRTARTDTEGRFRFGDLQARAEWSHGASVNYQGGEYLADPVSFDGGTTDRTIEVPVYDATTDPRRLAVRLHHVIFDPVGDGLRVTEVLLVRNPGDRTYVGDRELADGRRATLRFSLPAGSADIRYGNGLMDCCAVPSDGGFADTMDVKPGERQVAFSYTLGRAGQPVQFTRALDYPTDELDLLVAEEVNIASFAGLEASGTVTGENGKKYVRLAAGALPPQARLALTMEGIRGAGRRWWLPAGALLAALLGATGLYPIMRSGWRRRRPPPAPPGGSPELHRVVRGAEMRGAIAALDEARAAGKLTEEDHRRLVAERRQTLEEMEAPASAVEPNSHMGPRRKVRLPPRLWWAAVPLVLLGMAGGFLLVMGPSGWLLGSGGGPAIAFSPDLRDFGEIGRDAGKLEAVFTLRNGGKAPLRISRLVPT
jgi:hypothetical protein